jgi:hypothetical protein
MGPTLPLHVSNVKLTVPPMGFVVAVEETVAVIVTGAAIVAVLATATVVVVGVSALHAATSFAVSMVPRPLTRS